MWIRKIERDLKKGVDSPMPTQVVSNEEFIPRPQTRATEAGRAPDRRDGRRAREEAQHGPPRVHGQLDGPGHLLPASNRVYGKVWDVDEAETLRARGDRREVAEGRVLHHRRAGALHQRHRAELPQQRVRPQHGLQAQGRRRGLQLQELRQGDVLRQRDEHGRDLRRADARDPARRRTARCSKARSATPPFAILPSWLMARSKKEINDLAGSQRALCQGNLAPNHYWDKTTNSIDKAATVRADGARGASSTGSTRGSGTATPIPARTGNGFQLDDDNAHVVLRGVAQARHEAVQRAQGLLLPVAHARPPRQPEGRREGGAAQSRLQLRRSITRRSSTARTSRTISTATSSTRRPATSRGTRADGHQEAQPEDEQRLSARSAASSTRWWSQTR